MSASQSDCFSHMVHPFVTWKSATYEEKMGVDAMILEAAGKLGYEKVKEDQRYVLRKFVERQFVLPHSIRWIADIFPLRHIRDALAKEAGQCSNCIPQCNKVCYSVPRPFLLQAKVLARETRLRTPSSSLRPLLQNLAAQSDRWWLIRPRSKQEEIISAFHCGNDVFGVLPTGYGKTLCFSCLPSAFDLLLSKESIHSLVVVISLL